MRMLSKLLNTREGLAEAITVLLKDRNVSGGFGNPAVWCAEGGLFGGDGSGC
jgi:hypothetical protein